ncbi:MAG: class I SAM-dependent methyltransferase [Mahellales bacterium]|jgi:SAM-dependent methyltransferase
MHWYEKSFGKDYLKVYSHRNDELARKEVDAIIKVLDIKKDEYIMDLCCGSGRHSISLAQLGYRVLGVDLSEYLLKIARARARSQRIEKGWVEFKRHDMRSLPYHQLFDVVLNLFTSFGYFSDDKENFGVIMEISKVLKKNGRVLLDYLNPNHVRNNIVPFSYKRVDGLFVKESRWIENNTINKKIIIGDKYQWKTYTERVKLYTLDDFKAMFRAADLKITKVYGSYSLEGYHKDTSPRILILGTKV